MYLLVWKVQTGHERRLKGLKRVTKHGDIGNDYMGVMKVGNLCAPLGDFWSL